MPKNLKTIIGFGLSALLLWLAMDAVPLGEVSTVLRESNPWLFCLCALVATLIFPLRARRWQTILEPIAGKLLFSPLWRSTAIGMMINNIVPARAGEFARAFSLSKQLPAVPFTTALASLAVDRVFDGMVLLGMMFAAMLSPAFPSDARILGMTVPQFASGGMVAVAGLLIVSVLAAVFPNALLKIMARIFNALIPRFSTQLLSFTDQALGGLAVLRDVKRFFAVLWWAVLHWLVHALALWIGFQAVGIDQPFSVALFLQGVLGFAVAVPSSPGFVGVFEFAAQTGLGVYGIDGTTALSWAIGYHVLSFIPITVIGLYYLMSTGMKMSDVRGGSQTESIGK